MLDRCYANDAAFDGRFITGVLSTGIYCLPSCTARAPKRNNIKFFNSPEAAKQFGLRACLRCRPDDFYKGYDLDGEVVEQLVREINQSPEKFNDVEAIVDRSGLGATKLHRDFIKYFHLTPSQILARARLARAQVFLEQSDAEIVELAFDVGYQSLSTFYDHFKRMTGLSPAEYRRLGTEFSMALPPKYPLIRVLRYLFRLEEPADSYGTAVATADGEVPIQLRADGERLVIRHHAPRHAQCIAREVARWLGLDQPTEWFCRQVAPRCGVLQAAASTWPQLVVPQTRTLFESLIWVVVGQQINLSFAYRLMRRLRDTYGAEVGHTRLLPGPAALADAPLEDLQAMQFSRRKAEYLVDLARWFDARCPSLNDWRVKSTPRLERELLALRGLGPWSVNYMLLRGLARLNAYPVGDAGLHSALRKHFPDSWRDDTWRRQKMDQFEPFRGLATMHLWNQLKEVEP